MKKLLYLLSITNILFIKNNKIYMKIVLDFFLLLLIICYYYIKLYFKTVVIIIIITNTVTYKRNAKSKILTLKAYNLLIIGIRIIILYLF